MKIIEASTEIIYPSKLSEWLKEVKLIELAARNCYKSEDKITDNSWKKMVKKLIELNHGAMLEFGNFICRIITDRGVTHELVRHRLASYAQESTRYCNYSQDKFNNELTFVKPSQVLAYEGSAAENGWLRSMEHAENSYLHLIQNNCSPQQARSVLPNSLKTEIIMKCNWRELMYIIKLRTSPAAHPDIVKVFKDIQAKVQKAMPEVFAVEC